MPQLHYEVGISQLPKMNEELCGDTVAVETTDSSIIVVISDGLGSGVKANILSTLTARIAAGMLKRKSPLAEVVKTIAHTLPVCRQRKIAYSTLQVIISSFEGQTTVVEFDCPTTCLLRQGNVVPFPTVNKEIAGKIFKIGQLEIQQDDVLVAVSDGVIHAGIGGLLKLGWGWNGLADRLLEISRPIRLTSRQISEEIINCCQGYYTGQPGDDCTAVVIKTRFPNKLCLWAGPPRDSSNDETIVNKFLNKPGKKVIAGGTTANIVNRITGIPLKVSLTYQNTNLPPIGCMEGIDLVTEGILTLNSTVDILQSIDDDLSERFSDGASLMAKLLIRADVIDILAGGAINPAHQSFPFEVNLKRQIITKMKKILENKGKLVTVEYV